MWRVLLCVFNFVVFVISTKNVQLSLQSKKELVSILNDQHNFDSSFNQKVSKHSQPNLSTFTRNIPPNNGGKLLLSEPGYHWCAEWAGGGTCLQGMLCGDGNNGCEYGTCCDIEELASCHVSSPTSPEILTPCSQNSISGDGEHYCCDIGSNQICGDGSECTNFCPQGECCDFDPSHVPAHCGYSQGAEEESLFCEEGTGVNDACCDTLVDFYDQPTMNLATMEFYVCNERCLEQNNVHIDVDALEIHAQCNYCLGMFEMICTSNNGVICSQVAETEQFLTLNVDGVEVSDDFRVFYTRYDCLPEVCDTVEAEASFGEILHDLYMENQIDVIATAITCSATSHIRAILPEEPEGTIRETVVCENEGDMNLYCPPGTTIKLLSYNYGRTSSEICPHRAISDTHCRSENNHLIYDWCDGQQECSFGVTNWAFNDDPCPNTYKYAEIAYECLSEVNFFWDVVGTGWCRFGDNEYDFLDSLDSISSLEECQVFCESESACRAVSYAHDTKFCNRYSNGPYTYAAEDLCEACTCTVISFTPLGPETEESVDEEIVVDEEFDENVIEEIVEEEPAEEENLVTVEPEVITCGEEISGSTEGARNVFGNASGDKVFRFTMDHEGVITFSSCDSLFDTAIHIFEEETGTEMCSCDDCGPCGLQAELSCNLFPGDYLVVLDGFGMSEGDFLIQVQCDETLTTQPPVVELEYFISQEGIDGETYADAQEFCAQQGGTVAVVRDLETLRAACRELSESFSFFIIDGTRVGDDVWATHSDEELVFDELWSAGQPQNVEEQLFVAMSGHNCYLYDLEEIRSSTSVVCERAAPHDGTTIDCGVIVSESTRGAENVVGNTAGDHLYNFVVDEPTTVTFSTCGSNFDTHLRIFDESFETEVCECDDCGECEYQSVLECDLTPGRYHVVVDGYSISEGEYVMEMTCEALPLEDFFEGQSPYWCTNDARERVGIQYSAEACQLACLSHDDCVGAEWWEGGDLNCYMCFDLALVEFYEYTEDVAYPPHVFKLKSAMELTTTEPVETEPPTHEQCDDFDGFSTHHDLAQVGGVCNDLMSIDECFSQCVGDDTCFAFDFEFMYCCLWTELPTNMNTYNGICTYTKDTIPTPTEDVRVIASGFENCDSCIGNGFTWQPDVSTCTSDCDIMDTRCFRDITFCSEIEDPEPPRFDITCEETVVGTTVDAIHSIGNLAGEHIYEFTIDESEGLTAVSFSSCNSEFDTYLHIFDVNLEQTICECDDCGTCGFQAELVCHLDPGRYLLVVEGYSTYEGEYEVEMLCTEWPPNPQHIVDIECGATVAGTTQSELNLIGNDAGDKIFDFVLDEPQTVVFSTCMADFDTFLHVYDVSLHTLLCSCDDCGDCGIQTILECELPAGTFIVVVDGFSSSEGNFELEMTCPSTGVEEEIGEEIGEEIVEEPQEQSCNLPEELCPHAEEISCGEIRVGNNFDDSVPNIGNSGNDRIFTFSLEVETLIVFSTCESEYDTLLHVFSSDMNEQHCTCDDCGDCGFRTVLDCELPAGDYVVVLDGFSSFADLGNYHLEMLCAENRNLEYPEEIVEETTEVVAPNRFSISCDAHTFGNTENANDEFGHLAGDHVYEFTIYEVTSVEFSSCDSEFDTYLRIIDVSTELEVCECDDCGECGLQSVLTCQIPPGEYLLVVEGFGLAEGDYSIQMICNEWPPLGHELGTIGCGEMVSGSTSSSENLVGNNAGDKLFQFTVEEPQTVVFSTCNSEYDTYLHIFDLDLITLFCSCDDCGDCGLQSVLECDLEPGQYIVVVDGYSAAEGDFELEMDCALDVPITSYIEEDTVEEIVPPQDDEVDDYSMVFGLVCNGATDLHNQFPELSFDECLDLCSSWDDCCGVAHHTQMPNMCMLCYDEQCQDTREREQFELYIKNEETTQIVEEAIDEESFEEGSVRLVGGSTQFEGRVEFYHDGEWGTVCDDYFATEEAEVLCSQLGFGPPDTWMCCSHFGRGDDDVKIWLDNLECQGGERTIAECATVNEIGIHNCNHGEDVSIRCTDPEIIDSDQIEESESYEEGSLRLIDGPNELEGRVEIYHDDSWGSICDDSFSTPDADVVCRQLGFGPALSVSCCSTYGDAATSLFIWLDNVHCAGTENNLSECQSNGFGVHNCHHSEDVGIRCSPLEENEEVDQVEESFLEGDIRLVDGESPYGGRVEIYHSGEWGTICDDHFDQVDADVVCHQLDFGLALDPNVDVPAGIETQPIWLDDINCVGNESKLRECPANDVGIHNCRHSEDVGILCEGPPQEEGVPEEPIEDVIVDDGEPDVDDDEVEQELSWRCAPDAFCWNSWTGESQTLEDCQNECENSDENGSCQSIAFNPSGGGDGVQCYLRGSGCSVGSPFDIRFAETAWMSGVTLYCKPGGTDEHICGETECESNDFGASEVCSDDPNFDSGYGVCSGYSMSSRLNAFCGVHTDITTGRIAYEACPVACGVC